MLLEKLSENQIELAGYICDPVALSECLFTKSLQNLESLKNYSDEEFGEIRLYQLPYMSYEYLLAEDPELSFQENFNNKKGSGDGYAYTGRKTGKSLVFLLMDMLLDTVHHCVDWTSGMSSFDDDHVANICEPYISTMKHHPFFKLFLVNVKRKPYKISIPTGHMLKGVNMALSSRTPGSQFESQHFSKIFIDEHQYEIHEVVKRRSQAISEYGTINRFAGITSFTNDSPAGVIFNNLDNESRIINIPQTVSPAWDELKKKAAINDYGDENAPAYKIHVMAQVIDDAESIYLMDRIRKCYFPKNKDRPIKHFEFHKDDKLFDKNLKLIVDRLERKLVIERLKNADLTYIASDFGENITEIIIIFEIKNKDVESLYKYIYSITLFKMTPDEQTEIFKYLIEKLQAELTGIDCSDSGGKQVYRNLNKIYDSSQLIWVAFQEKIDVAIKYDNNGNVERDKDGKILYEQEYVSDWSVSRIKDIFYKERIDCLYDPQLDKEFNNMISTRNLRDKYKSKISRDHKHQSIVKNEIVLCKINNKILSKPIEEIEKISENKKLEVPTYDNGNLVWKPAKIYKEKNKGNLIYSFDFNPCSCVDVTEGHSMLIWDSNTQSLIEKEAKNVKIGDIVLSIDSKKFNLLKSFTKYVTYKVFNKYKQKFELRRIILNKKLAYLFGIFTAKGYLTGLSHKKKNLHQGIILYIGTDYNLAKKILKYATDIFSPYNYGNIYIRKAGTKVSKNIISKTDLYNVVYYGRGIAKLFSNYCGRGAKNKKVPNILFTANKNIIKSYLRGLYDGNVNKNNRLITVSKQLVSQIIILNGKLGYYSSYYKILNKYGNYKYYIQKGIRDGYYRNIPLKALKIKYLSTVGKSVNRKKLSSYFYQGRHQKFTENKKILELSKDFNFLQVKKIKNYKYDDYVYDLCVKDNNNFVAGLGNIIIHNSFQVFAIMEWKKDLEKRKKPNKAKTNWGTGVTKKI